MHCPDEKTLSSYLDGKLLDEALRQGIEAHISQCTSCLDLLVLAYEAQKGRCKCPASLEEKIKTRLGLRHKNPRRELKWLFGAVFLFALSFVFKRYFVQFLVAAAILGFKWVMEGEGARRAIMIFKGIEPKEKKSERKPPSPLSRIRGGDRHGEGE